MNANVCMKGGEVFQPGNVYRRAKVSVVAQHDFSIPDTFRTIAVDLFTIRSWIGQASVTLVAVVVIISHSFPYSNSPRV